MLLGDDLPELCSYLIATLTHLANENICFEGCLIKDIGNTSLENDWGNLKTDNLPHNWSSMWLRLTVE